MPITNAPVAPMPVHIVYAVPSGRVRIDQDRSTILMIIAAKVMTLGQRRVKPSDCFIAKAQTISQRPAMTRMNQATTASLLPVEPTSILNRVPVQGVGTAVPDHLFDA